MIYKVDKNIIRYYDKCKWYFWLLNKKERAMENVPQVGLGEFYSELRRS
ncbi:hypothetical protein GUT183_02300 [Streptococcus ruminantium]|nr:hypothetical protein GUT183_02300 [Streptococcus ruminantium]